MILRNAPPSPFGRKVRIAAAMLGLDGEIEIVAADSMDPADSLRTQNPLGKLPALILDDGTALYDSRVIVEYLDHRAGGSLFPPAGPDRFRALTQAALADGLIDAAILLVYEGRWRDPHRHEPRWVDHQTQRIGRALAAFEHDQPSGPRTIADVGLACALGYLDLRLPGTWRDDHQRLVEWLAAFEAEVPAFAATRVTG